MNKFLIATPIAVALAVAPYLISQQAETRYKEETARLSEYLLNNGLPVRMDVAEYKGGFLTSKAVNRLVFSELLSGKGSGVCFDLVSEIKHDYLTTLSGDLLRATTIIKPLEQQSECGIADEIENNAEFAAFYKEHLGSEGPIIIESRLGFSGTSHIDFAVKPVEFEQEDNGKTIKAEMQPANGVITISADNNTVDFSLDWKGMNMMVTDPVDASNNINLSLDGYEFNAAQQRHLKNVWVGPSHQRIGALNVTVAPQGEKKNFSMAEIILDGDSTVDGDKFSTKADMLLKGVTADGHELGDLTFVLGFNQMDLNATDKLIGFFKNLNHTAMNAAASEDLFTEEQKNAVGEAALVLAKEGVIELKKIEYAQKGKKLSISGDMRLEGLENVSLEMLDVTPLMMQHILLNLEAGLDAELINGVAAILADIQGRTQGMSAEDIQQMQQMMVMQFSSMAQMYTQSGMLNYDAENDRYTSKLNLAKGELLVNGAPMPMPTGG